MSKNKELDQIERKIASVVYQDGIFDMVLGLALVTFGVSSFIYDIWPETLTVLFMFLFYAVLAVPLFLIQAFVTKPRLGVVKFKPKRKKRLVVIIAIVSVLLVVNIIIFILIALDIVQLSGNEYLMAVIFGSIPLVIFLLMGYFMDFPRLYLIGTLFSIAIFLMELFMVLDFPLISRIVVMCFGVLIISIGSVFLISFLKKYPKNTGDNPEF